MFLFVTSALAAVTLIGWPCQRMNWGWRNVWSTCSINSFAPLATTENSNTIPTGFRFSAAAVTPTTGLIPNGWFAPTSGGTPGSNFPQYLCTNAAATGTGFTAGLRNRCRRAIDAYGALVKTCGLPTLTAGNRGPNSVSPDWAPQANHQPHVTNVNNIAANAMMCILPVGAHTPADIGTPSTTCPGLLGWFTVVFNACGFSNAPGLVPNAVGTDMPNYFPSSSSVWHTNGAVYLPAGTTPQTMNIGMFCGQPGATAVNVPIPPQGNNKAWNIKGTATFVSSRCRKAMDQFGRTASRCHMSTLSLNGPAQAGGYSDPLRLLATGNVAGQQPVAPSGWNAWVPLCNIN